MPLNFGIKNLFGTSKASDLGVQKKPKATFTKEAFYQDHNQLEQNDSAILHMKAPHDLTKVTEAKIVMWNVQTNATTDIDINHVNFGQLGEFNDQHTGSDITTTYNMVEDILFGLDIKSFFAELTANDYVDVEITNKEADPIFVYGILFKYE